MFINIPNNFSSMWGELIYEYNSTDESDILIEILDTESEETLGVKKFYSSSSAQLNLAPILFETSLPEASQLQFSSTITAACGFPSVALSDGDTSCEVRTFTFADSTISAPAALSSMPENRLLCKGERDIITIIAEDLAQLSYTITATRLSDGESVTLQKDSYSISSQALQHTISADSFSATYQALYYTLYSGGEAIASRNYTLSSEATTGYRVAWLSKRGSIEHYTFPVVEEQNYLSSGATTRTLRSAYGTAEEVEALSEIISSPCVWRVSGDEYSELEILTTEQQIRSLGELMIVTIKVQENG